jgi:hypothetical protein
MKPTTPKKDKDFDPSHGFESFLNEFGLFPNWLIYHIVMYFDMKNNKRIIALKLTVYVTLILFGYGLFVYFSVISL